MAIVGIESPWVHGEATVKKLCEGFGLEGPAIKRAFMDYVTAWPLEKAKQSTEDRWSLIVYWYNLVKKL